MMSLNHLTVFIQCQIQHYIDYIIEKHKTLTTPLLIHIYIIRVSNSLLFKIKHGYKITMTLFGSTGKLIDKTKNGEKVPSLKVVNVVLVQRKLLENQWTNINKSLKYYILLLPITLVFIY